MTIQSFLESLSLESLADAFAANAIDVEALQSLTDADLKEMGVTALGHRKKILAAIAALNAAPASHAEHDGTVPNIDIEALPTLLALPWSEFTHESNPVLAMWAACDFVEIALKLCVMAGLAEHGGRVPETLLNELRDRVELPTLGKWLGMAQAVARHTPETSVLPLDVTVKALSQLLEGDGLLQVRNRLAHGGPVSKAEAARMVATWSPRLKAFVPEALGWFSDVRLIAIDEAGRQLRLCGERGEEMAVSDARVGGPPGSVHLVAGERVLPLGPLGSFDPSRRAVEVYVRRGEVRLQYLRMGDEGGICDSDTAALTMFQQLFAITGKEEGPRRFTIRSFDTDIRKEAMRRIGREKELETLNGAIAALEQGTLWIGGPAGIGKSNLMASAMERLLDHPPADMFVLPYRFRAGDDRCGRSPFLAFLRERLEKSEWVVEPEAQDGDEKGAPVSSDPVMEVRQLLGRLREGARVMLLLDGLDEVVERDPTFLDGVLYQLLVANVRVVGAGRPERGIPEWFHRRGAVDPFPSGLPPMSEDDVRALLLERTGPVRKRLLARDRESGGAAHNAFITRVAQRSEGLPIYVNYVVGDLNAGRVSPENVDSLPESLHAYHDELLRRASVGDLQAVTTPALVLLALANEPLSVAEVTALLKRRGVLSSEDVVLVERSIAALASMLRRAPDPDGEEGFTLFHYSLRTHIVGSDELRQTVGATRAALANAALSPQGDASETYLFRNGIRHLLAADRRDEALKIQTDFALVMQRFQRLEASGRAATEWFSDWERLRTAPFEGDIRVWWDFARTNRHYFRKEGWESWRVLFQAAMDHADDSVVTIAAERFFAEDKAQWSWLRLVNRPKVWRESPVLAVLEGHSYQVNGAEVLPDGRILSWSGDSSLRLWDGATGAPLAVLEGHSDSVNGAEVLPDGRILSWSHDHTLRLWDGATGAPLAVLEGHSGGVYGAEVLPEGRILSWSSDKTLRLWDGATGAPLAVLEGHSNQVEGAKVLPDGRILSWSDETLRLWDGATGAQLYVWRSPRDWELGPDVRGPVADDSHARLLRLDDATAGGLTENVIAMTRGRHVLICHPVLWEGEERACVDVSG